jgi:hypothetical protein
LGEKYEKREEKTVKMGKKQEESAKISKKETKQGTFLQ